MEEKMMTQDKLNRMEKSGIELYFETHTQDGYKNLVQFLSDVFCLSKQVRRLSKEELTAKFDLLQQMLENTPKELQQYPMNCFLELKLTLTERALLVLLIRKQLLMPMRGLELDDVLLGSDGSALVLEEVFAFFVLRKGTLRQSPFIKEQRLGGCVLSKAIEVEKPVAVPKKPVLRKVSPQDIRKQLDKFVVGQEEAKEKLAIAFFEHLVKCDLQPKNNSFYKNNVFLIGPTGTGKTYLCQKLAQLMKVPFLHVDMSQYTASGYVGNSVKDIIANLAEITQPSQGKLPISIVFLDEIDKITAKNMSNNGRDIHGSSVQEELLRMLESKQMRVEKQGGLRTEVRTYDISNVFFVAAGACSGLEKIVQERLKKGQGMGFVPQEAEFLQQGIQAQDLLEYGFLPEFLSRFSYVAQLKPLTTNQLADVLLHTKNNLLSQYKEVFSACKQPLRFTQAHVQELAQQAYGHELGVRALHQLLAEEITQRLGTLHYQRTIEKEVPYE